MLMNYVFTLDSVRTNLTNTYVLLIHFSPNYVNETTYLLGNLPFFMIHVSRFMARDDSRDANVISKCMLWVRGLVPL